MKAIIITLLCCFGTFNFFAESITFPQIAPGEITFIGNAGSDNVFVVNQWKFTRVENVDQPEAIGISAVLDMTSITTDWKDLEKSLHKKSDYFHSKKWKTATVEIDGAEVREDGSYLADAILTIKGISAALPVAFTLEDGTDGTKMVNAEAEVTRQVWGFTGGGPKDVVPVRITAKLQVNR